MTGVPGIDKGIDLSVDWLLLKQINNEQVRLKLGSFAQQARTFFYDIALEFLRVQTEVEKYKAQIKQFSLNCKECAELKKRISVQDAMLTSLGSSIVKLSDTRQLDDHISEAFRIFAGDEIIPTPPPESEKPSPKLVPEREEKHLKNSEHSIKDVIKPRNSENNKKCEKNNKRKYLDNARVPKESVVSDCSDVSITDESIYEIHGTPTGRASPVLQSKVLRSRRKPQNDQRSYSNWASPKSKVMKLSQTRGGTGGLLRQTRLVAVSCPRRVDLTSSAEFEGGARCQAERASHPKLEFVKTAEDDDVILPSPTSESINKNFSTVSERCAVPRSPAPEPRAPAQDETAADLLVCDVDFDGAEGEILAGGSPNILAGLAHGAMRSAPTSPVLCENRNVGNARSPARRAPAPAAAGRENAPLLAPAVSSRVRPAKSPSPGAAAAATEGDASLCEAEASYSLLRHYGARRAAERHEPKKITVERPAAEPEFVYKEEVVRKRAEKQQLPGWSCEDCEKYWAVACGGDAELQRRGRGACSRHRGRFDPAPAATPPGFWDLHLSVPDDTHRFNRLNGVE